MSARTDRKQNQYSDVPTRSGYAGGDAIIAAIGYVQRGWGEHGYSFSIVATTFTHVVVRAMHSDGSRFDVQADRYGNVTLLGDASAF